jgi:hypothetical protein
MTGFEERDIFLEYDVILTLIHYRKAYKAYSYRDLLAIIQMFYLPCFWN